MKPLFISLLQIFFFVSGIHGANPLSSFYAKNGCKTRVILVSINLADCNNCIAPLGRVIRKFKEINPAIPVYLVMSDSLPAEGEKIYRDRNEIRTGDMQFIYDKVLNEHLLSKTDYIPNVALVSENHKILCIRNLKTDSQEQIMEDLSPEFKITINKKTAIRNKYAPIAKEYNNVIFFEKTFYIFSESMGLIAKYDQSGANLRNFFIDSLGLDYPKLAKEFFSSEDYASSIRYYEEAKPRKGELIAPITIFKMGEGLLGIGFHIESCRDTIYKKQSVDLRISHPFIIVVDTGFRFVKRLTLSGPSSGGVVLHSQVLYQDSVFYFLRWNRNGRHYQISEFKEKDGDLTLKKEELEPFRWKENYYLQILSNEGGNPDALYINYAKYRRSLSRLFNRNTRTNSYEPEVKVHMTVMATRETKKGNYILMTRKKGEIQCRGYDSARKKPVEGRPATTLENVAGTGPKTFFLFDGFLYELSYTE